MSAPAPDDDLVTYYPTSTGAYSLTRPEPAPGYRVPHPRPAGEAVAAALVPGPLLDEPLSRRAHWSAPLPSSRSAAVRRRIMSS